MRTSKSTFHYVIVMHILWSIIFYLTIASEYDHTRFVVSLCILQILIVCVYLSQAKLKYMRGSFIICGCCLFCVVLYGIVTRKPMDSFIGFVAILWISAGVFVIRKQCQYKDMLRKHYPWILRKYNMFDFTQGREKERFLEDALKKEMENEGDDRAKNIMELRSSIYAIGFLHFEMIIFFAEISMVLESFF